MAVGLVAFSRLPEVKDGSAGGSRPDSPLNGVLGAAGPGIRIYDFCNLKYAR